MGWWGRKVALFGALALLLLGIAGCGSGSSSGTTAGSTTDSTATQESQSTTSEETESAQSKEKTPPSPPSKEFLGSGKQQNAPAKFGTIASPEELAAVSQLVEESIQARAAKDWEGQCATLSARSQALIQQSTTKAPGKCSDQLATLGKGVPKKVLADNMADGVAVFRFQGSKGFALYHGNDGKDWAMPMEEENGEWKVGALLAEELPR